MQRFGRGRVVGWARGFYAYGEPGWGASHRPLHAHVGTGYRTWGWRRPMYAYAGPAQGLDRPLDAAAVPLGAATASTESPRPYSSNWGWDGYGYVGPAWSAGWWGDRRPWWVRRSRLRS